MSNAPIITPPKDNTAPPSHADGHPTAGASRPVSVTFTETHRARARPSAGASGSGSAMPEAATDAAPEDASDLLAYLEALPDAGLLFVAAEAPRILARRQSEREQAFFAEYMERARALNVTPERFAAAVGIKLAPLAKPAPKRAGTTAATATRSDDARRHPKAVYRNPNNHAQVWTKKGLQPK